MDILPVFTTIADYLDDESINKALRTEMFSECKNILQREDEDENFLVIINNHNLLIQGSNLKTFYDKKDSYPLSIFSLRLEDSMCNLMHFPYLRELDLFQAEKINVKSIASIPLLEELQLTSCKINVNKLVSNYFANLKRLTINNTIKNFNKLVNSLRSRNLPNLESLELPCANLEEYSSYTMKKFAKFISKMPKLTNFNFGVNPLGGYVFTELFCNQISYKNIKTLSLEACDLEPLIWHKLKECCNNGEFCLLEKLEIGYNKCIFSKEYENTFLECIDAMVNLKYIDLTETNISNLLLVRLCEKIKDRIDCLECMYCHIDVLGKQWIQKILPKVKFTTYKCQEHRICWNMSYESRFDIQRVFAVKK